MKIEKLKNLFTFSQPLYKGCEIQCPGCKKWSKHTKWINAYISCDLCGDHAAATCPKCKSAWDSACFTPTFNVK